MEVTKEWLELTDKDAWHLPPDYTHVGMDLKHYCQYPVEMPMCKYAMADCGEVATHWIWWEEYGSGIHICAEHLEKEVNDD